MQALTPEQAAAIDTPHVVWGVDADGLPLGLVPADEAFAIVGPPPATGAWRWAFPGWAPNPSLDDMKQAEVDQIDAALAARDLQVTRPAGEIAQALALGQAALAPAIAKLQEVNAAKDALRSARAAVLAAPDAAALAAITWTP